MRMVAALVLSMAAVLSTGAEAQRFYARQQLPTKTSAASTPAATPAPTPAPTVPPNPIWTACAVDFNICQFTGPSQIQYGVPGAFIYTNVAGDGAHNFYCHPDSFSGSDPAFGTQKTCYFDARFARR